MNSVFKRIIVVTIIEVAMLLGIIVAVFTLPRSTPLSTFSIISSAVFLTGNVLLFRRLKPKAPIGDTSDAREKDAREKKREQQKWRFFWVFVLLAIYWFLWLLLRHL